MIRLLLVDDHPVVRSGYRRLLEQGGEMTVAAEAGNVDEACAMASRHEPDLTITDLSMSGSGGLELIRRLLERHQQARVLVFSMHDSEMLVARALELGARGYVTKRSAPECLIDAVNRVIGGRRYLSPDLAPRLLECAALRDDRFESLTHREFEIFRQLAAGASLAECARALHLSPKTVSNHQTLIKDKLGLGTSAAMAHLALRHGVIALDGN